MSASRTVLPPPPPERPLPKRLAGPGELIDQHIRRTRRQVKWVEIFQGLLVLTVVGLAVLLGATMADHWLLRGGLPDGARWAIWLVWAGWSIGYFWVKVLPLIVYRIHPLYAAQTIESARPSLRNNLINFLLLRNDPRWAPEPVVQAVEESAARELVHLPPEGVVDRQPVIRWGYALVVVLAILALYIILSPKSPLVSFSRVLWPWADIPAPTRVRIEAVQPGDTVAPRGEPVRVSAEVHGLVEGEEVLFYYSTADGQIVRQAIPMKEDQPGQGKYSLPMDSFIARQDTDYYIQAGDARTRTYHIQVDIPLVITAERLVYEYPSYTGLGRAEVLGQGDIRAIEGTRVTVHASANQPLSQAEIDLDGQGRWRLPMQIQGQSATGRLQLRLHPEDPQRPEYSSYLLRAQTLDGRTNPRPNRYMIEVLPDRPPRVSLRLGVLEETPEEIDLPRSRAVEIHVEAEDADFGLRRVGVRLQRQGQMLDVPWLLDWKGGGGARGGGSGDKSSPVPASDSAKGKPEGHQGLFQASWQFQPAQLGLKPGDVVVYWARAEDTKLPTPNVAETPRRRIVIVEDPPGQPPPEGQPRAQAGPGPQAPGAGQPPDMPPKEPPPDQQQQNPQEKQGPGQPQTKPESSEPAPAGKEGSKPQAGPQGKAPSEGSQPEQESGQPPPEQQPAGPGQNQPPQNQPGENQPREKQLGQDQPGQHQPGQNQPGQNQPGQNQTGQGQTAQNQPGQNQPGQNPSGQNQPSGSAQPGQERPQPGPQQPGQDKAEPGGQPQPGQPATQEKVPPAGQEKALAGQQPGQPVGQEKSPPVGQEKSEAGQPSVGQEKAEPGPQQPGLEAESGQGSDQAKPQPGPQTPTSQEKPSGAGASERMPSSGQESGSAKPAGSSAGQENAFAKTEPPPGAETEGAKSPPERVDPVANPGKAFEEILRERDREEASGKPPAAKPEGQPEPKPGSLPESASGTPSAAKPGLQPEPQPGRKPEGKSSATAESQPSAKPEGVESASAAEKEKPAPAEAKPIPDQPQSPQPGPSGQGKTSPEQGPPEAQEANQPRPGPAGLKPPGGELSQEPQSPSISQKQSDSRGDQSGDRSGGGQQGGGQQAPQPGAGTPGSQSPAEQGRGVSDQPGPGEQTSGPGQQKPSAKPTGSAGQETGPGQSAAKPGSASKPADQPSGKPTGAEKTPPGGEKPSPEEPSGQIGTKPPSQLPEGPTRPGGRSEQTPPGSRGSSSETPSVHGAGNPETGGRPGTSTGPVLPDQPLQGDDPNLQYTRQAVDMALEYLRDRLREGDLRILEKLRWSREDAESFLRRWEELKRQAAEAPPGSPKRQELDEMLKNLGLRPRGVSRVGEQTKPDDLRRLREGRSVPPPPDWAEQFRAFRRGIRAEE